MQLLLRGGGSRSSSAIHERCDDVIIVVSVRDNNLFYQQGQLYSTFSTFRRRRCSTTAARRPAFIIIHHHPVDRPTVSIDIHFLKLVPVGTGRDRVTRLPRKLAIYLLIYLNKSSSLFLTLTYANVRRIALRQAVK